MALAGARMKPAALRVLDGTPRATRHGEFYKKIARSGKKFGKLKKPGHFGAVADQAWRDYIEPASWLDRSREVSAICFCELYEAYRDDPKSFSGQKHAQMRAYMAELGLTDERRRLLDENQEDQDDGDWD